MKVYALYLESGPKHKKTQAHVLELLGCTAEGPTTEAALEATPEAIRNYLGFLKRHGEKVDPHADFKTKIAVHVTEGSWLGNGDPVPGFAPDFDPLSPAELKTYLHRLDGLHAELSEAIHSLTREQLLAKPETGRSIHAILQHMAASHGGYVRYLVGKVDGLAQASREVEEAPSEIVPLALTRLWKIENDRLKVLTETERCQSIQHGQITWTARRALRRMLEHDWEHFQEMSRRLEKVQPQVE